jgi:hypothetical protein
VRRTKVFISWRCLLSLLANFWTQVWQSANITERISFVSSPFWKLGNGLKRCRSFAEAWSLFIDTFVIQGASGKKWIGRPLCVSDSCSFSCSREALLQLACAACGKLEPRQAGQARASPRLLASLTSSAAGTNSPPISLPLFSLLSRASSQAPTRTSPLNEALPALQFLPYNNHNLENCRRKCNTSSHTSSSTRASGRRDTTSIRITM